MNVCTLITPQVLTEFSMCAKRAKLACKDQKIKGTPNLSEVLPAHYGAGVFSTFSSVEAQCFSQHCTFTPAGKTQTLKFSTTCWNNNISFHCKAVSST